MSSALYQIFLKETLQLLKTMVIKSEASADALNVAVRNAGYAVNELDPTTWKYYLNLAGEYHPADQLLYVKSFDTLETIPFTKASLEIHRATAKAYAYGTPYYQTLVEQNPLMEELILGILNPVDIQTAISAPDLTILRYDSKLCEPQEENLIPEIQKWINSYWSNYYNSAYSIYHSLYTCSRMAGMVSRLVNVALGIRLNNCHTRFAHSYHIWTYLNGFGELRQYKGLLNTAQALWLYRNIRYITNNAGKSSTFDKLVENLLTKRNIPVSAIYAEHDTSKMPDELYPSVKLISEPINFKELQNSTKREVSVRDIVERESGLALRNADLTEEAIDDAEFYYTRHRVSQVPTKVIESNAIDRSESVRYRFIEVLVNQWIYLAHKKRYNVMLSIQNPATGELMSVSTKDAVLLWIWCFNRVQGKILTEIPVFEAKRVLRLDVPTKAQVRKGLLNRYVPDALLDAFYKDAPAVGLVTSTEAFYNLCTEIHENMLYRLSLATRQRFRQSRVYAGMVSDIFYADYGVDLGVGGTFQAFFKSRNFEIADIGLTDASILAEDILKKATGQDLVTRYTLREIQTALLRLMTQLSSYTIQYLQTTSSDPILPVGSVDLRYGTVGVNEEFHTEVAIPTAFPLPDGKAKERTVDDVALMTKGMGWALENKETTRQFMDVNPGLSFSKNEVFRSKMPIPSLRFKTRSSDNPDPLPALDEVLIHNVLDGFYSNPLES